ncbi:ribonuclease HII [Pelagibius sp.]|uniref:ribonuclease HII n=1 Tax=Pelagibius sp. TaxID=1931238 RepID=UPI002AC34457|nr:ribonuclease HII [Pelagibius sp.]
MGSDTPRPSLRIIGLDEAGRGPWAGPVVAAAVWLRHEGLPATLRDGLDDSKKLTARAREALFDALQALPPEAGAVALGEASVAEIDRLNILQASLLAMRRAAAALPLTADAALVDGNQKPDLTCPLRTVVKGDSRSLSIAAASVIAKVSRDRTMAALARAHPGYGWERNQGYGTAEHREGIARLGVTPQHRRSFRPIREAIAKVS